MRRLLTLLALSFAAACSADEFVTPGGDASADGPAADGFVPPDGAQPPDAGGGDGGTVDSGPVGPQLVPGIPANVDLFGVWAASASDYWVVGGDNTNNHGFAAHWNGSSFAVSSNPATAPLHGVWGTGAGVMAAGEKDSNGFGVASYFLSGWSQLPQATILAGKNVVAVWYDETNKEYALQTDANSMARSLQPSFSSVIDIAGSQIPGNAGPCYAMHARYAACATGVYAPNGSAPLFNTNKAQAIHVSNPNAANLLLFVAGPGGYLARYFNSGSSTIAGGPSGEDLQGIWSSLAGEFIAVGTNGTIIGVANGQAQTPTVVTIPSPTKENLNAVTAVGTALNRTFIAVGDKGTVVSYHF